MILMFGTDWYWWTDGWTDDIKGSTRGPRGPKKSHTGKNCARVRQKIFRSECERTDDEISSRPFYFCPAGTN